MLFDMGLPPHLFDDDTAVKHKINEIQQQFDLILIAERLPKAEDFSTLVVREFNAALFRCRFEESIVLLQDLLCWDVSSMTYLKMNSQLSRMKSTVSDEARQQLRQWLSADGALYDHFSVEFERRVDEFGRDRMAKEVRRLREENERVKERCGFEAVDTKELSKEFRPWGEGIEGYRVGEGGERSCQLHAMSENALIDEVRREQGARAREVLRERSELGKIS